MDIDSDDSNRIEIGETYWENVVMPAVLYGGNVVVWREIEKLQVIENEVLRRMVGAPSYVAMVGVRGEIGISLMIINKYLLQLLTSTLWLPMVIYSPC